jgi:hypothetical protein
MKRMLYGPQRTWGVRIIVADHPIRDLRLQVLRTCFFTNVLQISFKLCKSPSRSKSEGLLSYLSQESPVPINEVDCSLSHLKINSPYNIKCLVVSPNSLPLVLRMCTSSVSPKSAFSGRRTSVTRTSPKLSSVRSFRATSRTTVCPPSASSARVTCSTTSTSFPTPVPLLSPSPIGRI